MKKNIILLTTLILIAAMFVSCGKGNGDANENESDSAAELSTQSEEEALAYCTENYEPLKKMLDEIFTSDNTTYEILKESFDKYTEQYNILSEENKAKPGDYNALKTAYDEYAAVAPDFVRAAGVYVKGFREIQETECEITGIGGIVRDVHDRKVALFALSYKDAEGQEHEVYSSALCPKEIPLESVLSFKDSCYKTEVDNERNNALKNGNIVLDLNEVLEQADNL